MADFWYKHSAISISRWHTVLLHSYLGPEIDLGSNLASIEYQTAIMIHADGDTTYSVNINVQGRCITIFFRLRSTDQADRLNQGRDLIGNDRESKVGLYLDRVKEIHARLLARMWHELFRWIRNLEITQCSWRSQIHPTNMVLVVHVFKFDDASGTSYEPVEGQINR